MYIYIYVYVYIYIYDYIHIITKYAMHVHTYCTVNSESPDGANRANPLASTALATGVVSPDDLKLLVSNSQVQVQVLFWSDDGLTNFYVKKNWWKFVTQKKHIWKLSMVPSHLK